MSIDPSKINANGNIVNLGEYINFNHVGSISMSMPAGASQNGRKHIMTTTETPTMRAPEPQKNEGNTFCMHPPSMHSPPDMHPPPRENRDQTLPPGPGGLPLFPSSALRRDKHEIKNEIFGAQQFILWPYLFPNETMIPNNKVHQSQLRRRLLDIHSHVKDKGKSIARQLIIQRCNDESLCINGNKITEMKHVLQFFAASNMEVIKVLQAQPRALINLLDRLFLSYWSNDQIESWLFPGIISWFKAPKIGAVDYQFEIDPMDCGDCEGGKEKKSKRFRHVIFRVAIQGAYTVLEGLMAHVLTSYGLSLQRQVLQEGTKKWKNNLCFLLRGGKESAENKLYLIISLSRHPHLKEEDRNLSAEEALKKLSPSMADYHAHMLAISARQEFSVNNASVGALNYLTQAMERTKSIINVSLEEEHQTLSVAAKIMRQSGIQGGTLDETHQPNVVRHHAKAAVNANANLTHLFNQHLPLVNSYNSGHEGAISVQGQGNHTSFHYNNMGGTQNSGVQLNQLNTRQDQGKLHSLLGGTQNSGVQLSNTRQPELRSLSKTPNQGSDCSSSFWNDSQVKLHSLSNTPNPGSDSEDDEFLFGLKLKSITDPIDSASTNEKGG